jgi:hypothetical protein
MIVLQMPYLHWDTQQCFNTRATFLQAVFESDFDRKKLKKISVPPGLEEQRKALYEISKDYLDKASSFHPRRSLDQFFYSRLLDTTQRDNDQVVSKNTDWSQDGPNMVMVDQLWLWVIDPNTPELGLDGNAGDKSDAEMLAAPEKSRHQSIVTFFPRKECEDTESKKDVHWEAADLRRRILIELDKNPSESECAWYVAATTI